MSRRLRQLSREDYTVGWICALPVELAAAQEMLDEEHADIKPDLGDNDENLYALGSMGGHNVAIVCLPAGRIGNNPAAAVAMQMRATFKGIRFGLLVGIGGGVPSAEADIRLGDVVVSQPHETFSGVVQYDMGKATPNGLKRTGSLNSPPQILLAAVGRVQADQIRGKSKLADHTSKLDRIPSFQRSKTGPDVLFEATYDHVGGQTCELCSIDRQVARQLRESEEEVVVHYGTISSGNQVMRNAAERDRASAELGGVLCFEMEAAGLMNHFPCLVIRGVCDYADSHKNKQWQAYAAGTAAAWAKEVLSIIPAADVIETRRVEEAMLASEARRHDLLESLRFDQIDSRQMTIRNAHTKTCEWLLKNSEYLDWLDADRLNKHHGFLWIKGKPGTGKSTLMKFALINARERMKNKIIISFFFNARGQEIEKSTIGTYRSLLLQLLEWLPALQSVFDSFDLTKSSFSTDYQWTIESLKMLLEQAIKGLGESSVVCFIDALDECEEEQIRDMIQFFEQVSDLAMSNNIHFRVCFSSRHYPHITIRKGLGLVLEGQTGHTQDISEYLQIELNIGQSRTAQQIRSELQEKASGTFMWVVLVVGILNKEYDRGRIFALQRRLQEIPSDLHDLFRDIMTRDSYNRDEQLWCIQWVLFAKRPLSPEELYFAILSSVEPDAVSRWNPTETTRDVIERFILHSSKGLAEITTFKLQRVQFIHESVRDFLLKDGLDNIWPDLSSNLQGQSHERLKQCCLDCISMDVLTLLKVPRILPEAPTWQATNLRNSAAENFPFLEYAVHNVLYHADAAEGDGIAQAEFIRSFPLHRWVKLDNMYQTHELSRHTNGMTLLYVLAEHNMLNLIKVHASVPSSLDVGDERYGPPLFAAMVTGADAVKVFMKCFAMSCSPESHSCELYNQDFHDEVMSQSLSRDFKFSKQRTVLSYLAERGSEKMLSIIVKTGKVNVDLKDSYGRTPLWMAAKNGHKAVVKLLLETGKVNVDLKNSYGQTPLLFAAKNGHEAVVTLLLETGKVNVDLIDSYGQTPLWVAAKNRHEAVVKLLLETGKVNVNLMDSYGQTPLWVAAKNRHEAVVKLLLETGKVNVNLMNSSGQTLLWIAAENGHDAVVKLLLGTGKVNVDLMDISGQTPLWVAAKNRHEAVVKLLLETGKVNVNLMDSSGQTLLWIAAENGHEAIVKLLLETGKVNVELTRSYGQTPLWMAANNGHEAVVKLLLETGKVNVNLIDIYGQTPLWIAANNGHEAVVKLLLETGKVNVDLMDIHGQTPLWMAANNGHEAVVKLLLETGKVNFDLRNSYRQTPLWMAANNGHEAVVKLLLETGKVNVDLKNSYGQTPLLFSAKNGHEAVVKLLLGTGKVNVDLIDSYGQTPLWVAAKNRHETVVKLLLETGKVNVNLMDTSGQTLLLMATKNRHEAVVKLLLGTGKVNVDLKK
jgi:ankyrin repeat protein/nucleoside phosphorylase